MDPTKLSYEKYRSMFGSDGKQTISAPTEILDGLKSIKDGNYGQNLVSKSKYTVRGSLLGLVVGAAYSMYYKKSLFFGAVIGAISGTIVGNIVGELITKNKSNLKK